jgi:hypothetical protein
VLFNERTMMHGRRFGICRAMKLVTKKRKYVSLKRPKKYISLHRVAVHNIIVCATPTVKAKEQNKTH